MEKLSESIPPTHHGRTYHRRRWISTATLSLLAILVCVFQACSGCDGGLQFSPGAQTISQSGGDGRPIESKPEPGMYYHFVPGLKCNDTLFHAGTVEVTASAIHSHAIDEATCAETSTEVPIEKVQWSSLNPQFLGLAAGIYQKLAASPIADPSRVANQAPIAESWCRLRNNQVAADILVMETRATRELSGTLFSAKEVNGSWRSQNQGSLPVSRVSEGMTVQYLIAGLTLRVDRNAASASGALVGRITGNLGGTALDEDIECRLGSEYDAATPATPTFAFNLGDGQLPSLLKVSRTGISTYYDVAGNVAVAADGIPRFDFDPATQQPLGLLIEPASTNLLFQSANLTDPVWISTGLLVAKDGQLAGLDRFSITANDGNTTQTWGRAAQKVDVVASQAYSLTFFAQKGNENSARIFIWYGPGWEADVDVDLTNGQTQVVTMVAITVHRVSVVPVAGGYRVNVTFDSSNSGTIDVGIGPQTNTLGRYIYATGAQLETGEAPTSYIPTTTATASRGDESVQVTNLNWFNPSRGTLHLALSQGPSSASMAQNLLALSGSGSDSYSLLFNPSTSYSSVMTVGTNSATWNSANAVRNAGGATQQIALAYGAVDAALALNGSVTVAPSQVPLSLAPVSMTVGGTTATSKWSGHLRAFTYWPDRLGDSVLSEKTK